MAALTQRSTDCLGRRDAFRRYARAAAAVSGNKQARPATHGRKPRHAAATVQPQKCAMENVVILKRGEQVAPKSATTAAPAVAAHVAQGESAEPVAAACQLGAQARSEAAAGADPCGESSEKAETAAADDRCPAPTEKAEKASATRIKTEIVTPADLCTAPAKKAEAVAGADLRTAPARKAEAVAGADLRTAPARKAEAVAAANRIGPKGRKAEAAPIVYSGASFVVSPDPWELPVPIAFLKPRGGHTAACA